ncbi:MAG: hypothetical protein OSA97_00960 [Nevskia sp.]|nr:hypothetical protein [Nevskia sp.]
MGFYFLDWMMKIVLTKHRLARDSAAAGADLPLRTRPAGRAWQIDASRGRNMDMPSLPATA